MKCEALIYPDYKANNDYEFMRIFCKSDYSMLKRNHKFINDQYLVTISNLFLTGCGEH